MPRRFDHLVFDLDGTLVDSRLDLAGAVNHVLRSFARPPLPVEAVCEFTGEGARMLVQRALGPADADQVEEGLQRFLAYYGEHLLDHTRPYPGIVEALGALSARGILLSVLTNKPEDKSRAILDGLGLLSGMAAVIGGDSCPSRKPDPAGVERLRALAGTPRDRMLLVGDSLVDLHTAAAAGIAFCGVAWGLMPERLRAAAPGLLVAHPAELVPLVDDAQGG